MTPKKNMANKKRKKDNNQKKIAHGKMEARNLSTCKRGRVVLTSSIFDANRNNVG